MGGCFGVQRLCESFRENQYPDRATKERLCEELDMTFRQVLPFSTCNATKCHIFSTISYSFLENLQQLNVVRLISGFLFVKVSKWFENARWSFNHPTSNQEAAAKRVAENAITSAVPKKKLIGIIEWEKERNQSW